MPARSEIAILAPGIVKDAGLPRRWKRSGGFTDLAGAGDSALLARAFRIPEDDLADAALHYLGATGRDPGGYCLFAYPVYLHPRREQLVLMSGPEFELEDAEAQSMMAAVQAHYPRWRIERTADGMWFIIVDTDPDLQTTPLQQVLGEDINDYLPRGGDGMEWVGILNELQMILFDTEVNEKREAAGEPTVNSFWFWGGGRLPDIPAPPWKRVVTNDPVARGLGRHAGIETLWLDAAPSRERGDAAVAEADTLWVYSRPAGTEDQAPVLSKGQWRSLRGALRRREIGRLVLIEPAHGELAIDARAGSAWLPWR